MTQNPEPIYEYASLELVGYGTITVRIDASARFGGGLDRRVADALQYTEGWLDVERFRPVGGWSPFKVNLTHFAFIEPTTNPEEQQ